ncbi:MAG: hypothetical protein JNK87_36055 [Bryobacterales bacterium]|nr:hypothetical protein [Bryobacterales bacterium]
MATLSSRIYTGAARALAPLLHLPFVQSVYIRRSVAAGEAEFPWSDLDLGLAIRDTLGSGLFSLWRRFRLAQALFPRLGECQIATAEELAEMAGMDPYRASLDRRFAIVVAGTPPPIPHLPVPRQAAARRLIFWFEHYLPRALRAGSVRNQRKFVKEMANALGVVEGRWPEPLRKRAEAALPDGLPAGSPFFQCCLLAERAQRLLRPPAPVLKDVVRLPSLLLLPAADSPVPDSLPPRTIVATPAVLDLLLATQSPFLWSRHGAALEPLGFTPPPLEVWREACLRQASGERLRLPGFGENGPIDYAARLARAEAIAAEVLSGRIPSAPVRVPEAAPAASLKTYYCQEYDALAARARVLRQRLGATRGSALP